MRVTKFEGPTRMSGLRGLGFEVRFVTNPFVL